jgi:uncharacterized glyoxalase superfamily protein PhnB
MAKLGEQAKQNLKGVIPLLQVSHMMDTLAYYQDILGFTLDFAWPSSEDPKWVRVSRESVSFMLTIDLGTSSGQFIAEKGNGVVLYVIVDDVEALYAELVAREALIVQDVHEFGGRKQFSIADPNGYVIAFSQEFA